MKLKYDILVVEDEPVVAESTKKIMLPEGYTIDQTANVEDALSRLNLNKYSLIISDLMLPDKSGLELTAQVKKDYPELPVITITGYATHENAIKSFKTGVFDFIPKPFIIEELLGVVYRGLNYSKKLKKTPAEKIFSAFLVAFKNSDRRTQSLHFLGYHSWVQMEAEGSAVFGVGDTLSKRMGKIHELKFAELHSEVLQGNCCVQIIANEEMIHSVWAPLSGKIVEINRKVTCEIDLINFDPVNKGWLMKVIPANPEIELKNLTEYKI